MHHTEMGCHTDVVVVNYNAGKLLVDCVASILLSGARCAIVVDNGSEDGSIDALHRSIPDRRVRVIRNGQNLGFAAACNVGARSSDAERVLFLNPDGVLVEGALQRMLEVMESSESVGMVGGFLCNPDGSEQAGGRRVIPTPRRAFMRAFGLSGMARLFPELMSDCLLHREAVPMVPVPVEAISGACMLIRREAMKDVGLWDEGYFLHCEDLDMCMRFKQKGWTILFVPDARVVHELGVCSRDRRVFVEWHKHKGMLRFYRKFFRHEYPGVLMVLVTVGVWLRFGLMAGYLSVRKVLAKATA